MGGRSRHSRNNLILMIMSIALAVFLGGSLKLEADKQAKEADERQAISDRVFKEKQAERDRIQAIKDSLPRIVCWGDSLTAGAGGNGITYPSVLSSLIKLEVKNYGVGGEGSAQIAQRQGAIPIYVNGFTIPESQTPVEVSVVDENGNRANLLIQGDAGVNPCYINNIQGTLSYDKDKGKYYFTRIKAGDQTEVKDNTRLITNGMQDKKDSDILVIFSGTNDLPTADTVNGLIEVQKKMIEYADTDNYVIIGLTSKDYMPEIEAVNKILKKEYGDKYLDIRDYLLQNGLKDAGITPTEQDKTDLSNDEIPISLRADTVHGNSFFYTILGTQLYNKILDLGYLSSDQLEVMEITD